MQSRLDALAEAGALALMAEGLGRGELTMELSLDLRYRGQSYTLEVTWAGVGTSTEGFHQAHLARYGHRLCLPVELVNLRVRVLGPEPRLELPQAPPTAEPGAHWPRVKVVGWDDGVPVLPRAGLGGGPIQGPAIIVDPVATTWLAPSWVAELDAFGNLLLCGAAGERGPRSGPLSPIHR